MKTVELCRKLYCILWQHALMRERKKIKALNIETKKFMSFAQSSKHGTFESEFYAIKIICVFWLLYYQVGWPSGLSRWFLAPFFRRREFESCRYQALFSSSWLHDKFDNKQKIRCCNLDCGVPIQSTSFLTYLTAFIFRAL